ncbi:MAG: site-specific integrase, partial [Chthoniobacterales bacterium]
MTTAIKSKSRNSQPAAGLTTARPAKDKRVEEFLSFLEVERNASPRTLRIYRDALRDFREVTNPADWRKRTPQHFRDYL